MIHYLYVIFDREKNFYIGRRSYRGSDISLDRYMGSSKNSSFKPLKKSVISFANSLQELKSRERALILKFISHSKCKNLSIPPIKDAWGTFKWITNGKKNIQIRDDEAIPEGFKLGRFNPFGEEHPTKGCKQWIKDGKTKRCKECPGPGWKLGSYYDGRLNLDPRATTGMRWITNGVESKLVKHDFVLQKGWKYGRKIKSS
jgi:hypothetical protein